MNHALLVSYDLTMPSVEYKDLFKALKQDARWWHYLKTTWIVVGPRDAAALVKALRPHLFEGDRLLVTPIPAPDAMDGLLPQEAWDWLDRRLA